MEDDFEIDLDIFSDESELELEQNLGNDDQDNKVNNDQDTIDVNPEDLFLEDGQESVDSNDEDSEEVESSDPDKGGTTPNTYSSIAAALKGDGVLLNITDEDVDSIKNPDDLAEIIEKEVTQRLENSQRRIKEALDYGVNPEEVNKHTKVISYLDSLTEDVISEESEQGEKLRKQLIYQDFINRGFTEARAKRELDKSINSGSDVEDALEALVSNKEYFTAQYESVVNEAKLKVEADKKKIQKQAEALRKGILTEDIPYEGIVLDKTRRQKIYDSVTKIVDTTEDGRSLTAIQKYEYENPVDFKKKVAILYELTDGFKTLGNLIQGLSNKRVRKNIADLDNILKNTPVDSHGRIKLAGGRHDENSFSGLSLDLDD